MALSGGLPLDWLKPLRWDSTVGPNERGTHRGPSRSMNVVNALPGFIYYWARHPRLDRGSNLQRFINEGWEVVPPDSPEHKGRELKLSYSQFGLDNYQVHGDLVLLRIPEAKYREKAELRAQLAKAAIQGPTEDYQQRGAPLEERFGSRADGPIYYRGHGHGID